MQMLQKYAVYVISVLTTLFLTSCNQSNDAENWNKTVQKVSSGVVSIQTDIPVAFDGKSNRSSYATGFIVDAKNGIILTNRHVINPGPVTAKAILVNNEEIDLTPLYFDPVHDFGFFKYDSSQIKHLTPHQFTLSDSDPEVGEAIRIIGNDAGQKISILDGTISRLDRDAPNYGKGKYNDFNTFYIQAATSSTGGSSGSPVINIKGEAVALNAGSRSKSATAFYLPLEQIKIALVQLQNQQAIPRGTIKTTFQSTSYTELTRLGLTSELEQRYREQYPDLKGLLVVRHIIPQSNADEKLKVGDILLSINQQNVINFSQLEHNLNVNVGRNIEVTVIRQNEQHSFNIAVDDLQTLSPQSIVRFDGSTFHTLSYQQARHFNKPIQGVYVARSSSSFSKAGVPSHGVITEFNGVKVNTVEEFNQQLKSIESTRKVNLRYFDFSTPNTTNYALVEINRQWFEHSYCEKTADQSYWPCQQFKAQASLTQTSESSTTNFTPVDSENIENALVNVSFSSPYSVQGRNGDKNHYGTGVIVDIEKGWVVVARTVVFSMLGDVKITFNNRYEINGKVEYIHPLHNLALVSYTPSDLANAKVSQATFSDKAMRRGDPILQVGLNYDGVVEYRETIVNNTEELWLYNYKVPQFIDKNIKGTSLVNPNSAIDGVLVNTANEVAGLWIVFDASNSEGNEQNNAIAGLSAQYVTELLDTFANQKTTYSLDINLTMIPPVNAVQMGLSEQWINKIVQPGTDANKLLAIYNVSTSSKSAIHLKRGDLLLAINDIPVSTFKQVESLSQQPSVKVTYFSEGQIKEADIKTTALHGVDIEQVIYWSGLYLHAPHRAAQLQGNVSSEGVYVASYTYGSPATRYGIYAMQRIVEIDGKEITTTQDFIEAVKGKKHQESVLIKTISFNNTPTVTTLKVDNHYWPFFEMKYNNGTWEKIDHSLQAVQ